MPELLHNSYCGLFNTNSKERSECQNSPPKKGGRRGGKEGPGERKTNKDTHTHKTHTNRKKQKGRETGKRKDPKEGRATERTVN